MAIPHSKPILFRAMIIIGAAFCVFGPALRGDWLMDDDLYITENALLGDPARLWKIWFAPGSLIEYYPIEASVQLLQWNLWHLETLGYHLTNLLLHILGALLVWRVLEKFSLRLAWLGGLLFAIHPAVVESVAWISELKNTLSLPFFLLAVCAWIDYDARRRPRDYLLALGLFLVAMLCKISMALFPFVMLLHAWWKRGRIGWADLKATAPFFAVSLVLGLTTVACGNWFRAAHLQPTTNPDIGDLWTRLALAGEAIAFYFAKCLWPVNMLFLYPRWPVDSLASVFTWPILAGLIAWLWTKRATWGRHVLLGLGFFLINLSPFIGFNSVTYMQFTWVMDHFLYLPIIGLIALVVAALDNIENRISTPMRPVFAGVATLGLILLAYKSQAYARTFAGPETLWSYTLAHNPNSYTAHNNLANILLETGRVPEAIAEYRTALRLNPTMVEAYSNLGFALEQTGQPDEAIANYDLALKYNPHFNLAHANLADALVRAGRIPEAIAHYEQDLLVNPKDTHARDTLAKLKAPPK